MKAKLYLDFNSTHPPNRTALEEARARYFAHYANSSGLSLESQLAFQQIESAREEIARHFAVEPRQVLFTSSATESNNLLLREFHREKKGAEFHAISSPFEHPSVSEVLKTLDTCRVTAMPALKSGALDAAAFPSLDWNTDLVVAMAIQNESGIALPVHEIIGHAAPAANRLVDASQLLPKLCNDGPDWLRPNIVGTYAASGCFLTATGHKIGAGFGCGLIVTPPTHSLTGSHPLLAGGNQEQSLRAGSHNTEAILAFALALRDKLAQNNYSRWRGVTEGFEKRLLHDLAFVAEMELIGSQATRAPGTTLLLLPGVAIDFLVMALDREGITVSTGTSCKSRSRSPSQALMAMGYSEAQALSLIRLSYDQNLADHEAEHASAALAKAVAALL